MARARTLGRCPVCSEEMEVTRLYCPACRSAVEGRFATCKFCNLGREQVEFLEIFIRARGNIKEVEREMGISYPTVRNRLDNLIRALGFHPDTVGEADDSASAEAKARRLEILDKVSSGEMDADEAAQALREGKS